MADPGLQQEETKLPPQVLLGTVPGFLSDRDFQTFFSGAVLRYLCCDYCGHIPERERFGSKEAQLDRWIEREELGLMHEVAGGDCPSCCEGAMQFQLEVAPMLQTALREANA